MPRQSSFADLGSGLGMACFAAAFYFEREIIGFEVDPLLHAEAVMLAQNLRFSNVNFRNKDFLAADLNWIDVFYIFQPFKHNFAKLWTRKMAGLKPGAVIIANVCGFAHAQLLQNPDFQLILTTETGVDPNETKLLCFNAFRKKSLNP